MSEREAGEGYQGWRNYPTWAAYTWLSSDEGREEGVQDAIAGARDATQAANALRDWMTPEAPLYNEPTVFTDLLLWALTQVDWDTVARALGPEEWGRGGEGV